MQIIIFFIFFLNITCYSYIVKPIEEYKHEKVKLPDGNFKISYRNGETFIGSINKEELPIKGMIYKTGTQTLIGGITIERELFTIENNVPDWCKTGDCINGIGVAKFKPKYDRFPILAKNSNTYYLLKELEFKGEYKNFIEHAGKVYYKNNEEEMIVFLLKDGNLNETDEFKKYKVKHDIEIKEQDERRKREDERRSKEREIQEKKDIYFYKLLVSCGALHEYCRIDRNIEYESHLKVGGNLPCYRNDYNRGSIRSGNVIQNLIYYRCTMRGREQTFRAMSSVYINTNDDGSERCASKYEYLCN